MKPIVIIYLILELIKLLFIIKIQYDDYNDIIKKGNSIYLGTVLGDIIICIVAFVFISIPIFGDIAILFVAFEEGCFDNILNIDLTELFKHDKRK